jgi:hypothetical protein
LVIQNGAYYKKYLITVPQDALAEASE